MGPKQRLSGPAAALLAAQAGVISRHQLLGLGVSSRVIRRFGADGLLSAVVPGLYQSGPQLSWLGHAWAGVLIGGQGAVLGLEAAGHLHELRPEPAEITVNVTNERAPRPGWRFIRAARKGVGEPPRTSLDATVVDLCAEADEDELAALLAEALSSRRTTAKRLLAELATRRRFPHRRLVREVLGDVALGAHSALERRFLVDVERAHRLPTAKRQRHAHEKHRADAWFEEYGVLAELDGRLHRGAQALRDQSRDNDHAVLGLVTQRYGWRDVAGINACLTAHQLGQLLMQRGWEGPVQACPRCRLAHAV